MSTLSKPWDVAFTPRCWEKINNRRRSPDGVKREVKTYIRNGVECNDYPWHDMDDGDFFEVPIGDKSETAMKVGFRHSASRLNMEITTHRVLIGNVIPGYRVIRVCGSLRAVKLAARAMGAKIPIHDREHFKKREAARQRGETLEEYEVPNNNPKLLPGTPTKPEHLAGNLDLPELGTRERHRAAALAAARRAEEEENPFMRPVHE